MSAAANLHPGMESMRIRLAKDTDAEPLTRLINAAFRVEQPFIEGDRINPEGVPAFLPSPWLRRDRHCAVSRRSSDQSSMSLHLDVERDRLICQPPDAETIGLVFEA